MDQRSVVKSKDIGTYSSRSSEVNESDTDTYSDSSSDFDDDGLGYLSGEELVSAVSRVQLELDQLQKQLFDDPDFFLQLEKDIKEFNQKKKKEQEQKIGLDQTTAVAVSSTSAIGTPVSFFPSPEPQQLPSQTMQSPRNSN